VAELLQETHFPQGSDRKAFLFLCGFDLFECDYLPCSFISRTVDNSKRAFVNAVEVFKAVHRAAAIQQSTSPSKETLFSKAAGTAELSCESKLIHCSIQFLV
jgi:hypothetical protein